MRYGIISKQIDITNKYGLPLTKESKWIAHIDLDEYLYQHVPVDTINQIINKKTIYDKFLKRMVPSIFDPVSQKHQYELHHKYEFADMIVFHLMADISKRYL